MCISNIFCTTQVPPPAGQLTKVLASLRHTFVVADATLPDCPLVYASEGYAHGLSRYRLLVRGTFSDTTVWEGSEQRLIVRNRVSHILSIPFELNAQ